MSKRNIVWLTAIIVVGAAVWIAAGWLWGLIAAAVVLVVSEVIERRARARRQIARGRAPGSPLGDTLRSRRERR